MSFMPLTTAGRLALTSVAPGAGDNSAWGLLISSAGNVRAAAATPTQFQNGSGFTNLGQLCYVDATAGLPANTQFQDGLPYSPSGQLCVSTGAITGYQNEVPFVANGAVAATIV